MSVSTSVAPAQVKGQTRIPDITGRVYRGIALYAERGSEIQALSTMSGAPAYRVPSCSGADSYIVALGPSGGCSCRDNCAHDKHVTAAGLYHADRGRHTIISSDKGNTYRVHDRVAGLDVSAPTSQYTQALDWLVEEIDAQRDSERRVA